MKLQIAVDVTDEEEIMRIAEEVHDIVDIFEVGTPAVIRNGVHPVKLVKEKYPDLTILADTKIMDGGAVECSAACAAGADIVTVLAVSDNATIREVIHTAHENGREVMADLMCVGDIPARSKELAALGSDYICVHSGFDQQQSGRTPIRDLAELVGAIAPSMAAVAGGVKLCEIGTYKAFQPGIIISGGALCNARDIRRAAEKMKDAIDSRDTPGQKRSSVRQTV